MKRAPRTATILLTTAVAMVSAYTSPRAAWAVTSAELYSPTAYGYGRFETRVMFPAPDGVVGSFFLWKGGSEMPGAYWNELDFEKIGGNCALQINSIYGAPMLGHANLVTGATGLCAGYHTYTFDWTPDHIAWQVDGVETRRDVGAAAQAYADNATAGLEIRFNIWPGTSAFGGTFSPASLPVQEFISWISYARYSPGAGDAGTDFTLAWRESFEAGIPTAWGKGNWTSPLGQSVHSSFNVTAANGVAVMSLTADDAPGFAGVPPADPGDLPSATGAATGGDGGTGDGGGLQASGGSGCGCRTGGAGGMEGGEALLFALAIALLVRWRRRACVLYRRDREESPWPR